MGVHDFAMMIGRAGVTSKNCLRSPCAREGEDAGNQPFSVRPTLDLLVEHYHAQNDKALRTRKWSNKAEPMSQYLLSSFSQRTLSGATHHTAVDAANFRAVSCTTRESLLLILVLVMTVQANPRCWNT